jgi:S-adenosylmethionine:tRNA-ribosyltransferase-isomerase (queuine synthetase)
MRTNLWNGNEFLEKMKTSHFFQSDIWEDIYVVFIGRERMMEIYQHAITQKYRFFSYGDAMLLTGKK